MKFVFLIMLLIGSLSFAQAPTTDEAVNPPQSPDSIGETQGAYTKPTPTQKKSVAAAVKKAKKKKAVKTTKKKAAKKSKKAKKTTH